MNYIIFYYVLKIYRLFFSGTASSIYHVVINHGAYNRKTNKHNIKMILDAMTARVPKMMTLAVIFPTVICMGVNLRKKDDERNYFAAGFLTSSLTIASCM